METQPEIQFQGMQGTPQIEKMIAAHIAELDERFGRITACRVVVKAPSAHHREGDLYEVHIRLALPKGQEVNVERTPAEDERHSDLAFAISDAFKHARQQLHEKVRRMRGDVKHHDG
jgi:ribosome-associated translation inhibitor RaiA